MNAQGALLAHIVVCLALVALTYNATAQEWITALQVEPVVDSLVRKWLLFALALANLTGAFVVAALPPERRAPFITRHAALYLFVPLVLLFVRSSGGLVPGHLGVLYMALACAIALHLLAGAWHALERLRDGAVAALLGVIALAVFLAILPYHRTVQPTASDEPHYLLIVQSLLYDRDVDLRNDYEGERYRVFYPDRLPDMHGVEIGRAVYPIRDLGLPLASVLPFALGGRTGVLALICLAGALLAAQLFLLARDLGLRRDHAFLAVSLASFTHPVLTYTTQIYPELAVALVFATVARVVRRGRATTTRGLALASALAALLPLLSTRAWLIAAPVALVIAWFAVSAPVPAAERARRALAAAGPFAAGVIALALANGAMFGVYLPSAGYYIIRDQQPVLAYTPHVGALGLLFDRVFGLVGRAPLYLLALIGAGALWARRGTHGALLLVLAAGWGTYFAYIASIAYWWADGSPPSRYLLGSIPFLAVAVAGGLEALERVPRAARLIALGALAAPSAFVTFVYAVLPNIRYDLAADIRLTERNGQLFEFVGRLARPDTAAAFPSIVRATPLDLALGALWLALLVGLVLMGRGARGRAPLRREGTS